MITSAALKSSKDDIDSKNGCSEKKNANYIEALL